MGLILSQERRFSVAEENISHRYIPDWDLYFLAMTKLVAARSKDEQTQAGAVLTSKDYRILGTGYNSFCGGTDDSIWPKFRPAKYPHVIHAEENCLLNLSNPIDRKDGAIMYTNMKPCYKCLIRMANAGVTDIIALDVEVSEMVADHQEYFDHVIQKRNINYRTIKTNLSFANRIFK